MDLRTKLLDAFDRYCEVTGLQHATASSKAANDGKFYKNLLEGADVTTGRYEKIMHWFEKNTPTDKHP